MSDKAVEIAALLAPTIESLGVELLGVEYLPTPGSATLRLYIDVPAARATGPDGEPLSVTIEECEAVSREVSAQLDVEDPISSNYTLEVSSPGLDRPLFSIAQFERFVGQSVKVTLRLPQDGRRRLQGPIARVEDAMITFLVDGAEFTTVFENIDKARLIPDWAALGLAPARPGKGGAAHGTKDGSARSAPAGKQTTNPTTKPAADKPTPAE